MPQKKKATKNNKKITPKSPKNKIVKFVGAIAALAIFGLLGYSVYSYQVSTQEKEGFLVCNDKKTECELSQHIHADIHLTVCGKEIIFPKENGNTTRQHTHKEQNKIHWHAPLKVNPTTKKPIDPTKVSVASFLKEMKFTFPETCPNNKSPKLTAIINAKRNNDPLSYVWKDGDTITIVYE